MKYLSIIIVSLLLSSTSFAHPPQENSQALIEVTSTGTAKSLPDQVELQVSFSSTDFKADQARKQVERKLRPFLKELKTYDLHENSLDSSQTYVHPQYDYRNNQRQLKGYQVVRQVSFKLNALPQLEDIVELITSFEQAELSNMKFTLKDPKALKRKALKSAISKASKEAQTIAEGFGVNLGSIHKVIHADNNHSAPQMRMMAMSAEMSGDKSTYQQKEIEIKATVSASFNID